MLYKKRIPITSFTPEANAYRNMHRPKVDKFFELKSESKGDDRRKFDRLARQAWRAILTVSNKM